MKNIIFGILILMYIGCLGQKTEVNKNNSSTTVSKNYIKSLQQLKLESDISKSYESVKSKVRTEKYNFRTKKLSTDSLSTLFTLFLVNRIIPFWEGTEWSFEGHTSIPKKGEIACGYFVSTTLKDAGVNLNRYRLAQQSPVNEAKSLAINNEIIIVKENSTRENILTIKRTLKDGIHFIGFESSHVGYILKEKGQLYLIHSNYVDYKGVEIEKIEKSEVFASYDKYYIAELSTNKTLLESWVNGSEIKVVTQK